MSPTSCSTFQLPPNCRSTVVFVDPRTALDKSQWEVGEPLLRTSRCRPLLPTPAHTSGQAAVGRPAIGLDDDESHVPIIISLCELLTQFTQFTPFWQALGCDVEEGGVSGLITAVQVPDSLARLLPQVWGMCCGCVGQKEWIGAWASLGSREESYAPIFRIKLTVGYLPLRAVMSWATVMIHSTAGPLGSRCSKV